MSSLLSDLEVPKEVQEYRLNVICRDCPLLLNKTETMKASRCGDCGCFVHVKSGLKDFTCPKGKW